MESIIDWIGFGAGLATALLVGVIWRVLQGLRLNMYLLSRDSGIPDQNIISVTSEYKKNSLWHSLVHRSWKENVAIDLMDYRGKKFQYEIHFHPWYRYYLSVPAANPDTLLDGHAIQPGHRYILRNGSILKVGDRTFGMKFSTKHLASELHKEFSGGWQE